MRSVCVSSNPYAYPRKALNVYMHVYTGLNGRTQTGRKRPGKGGAMHGNDVAWDSEGPRRPRAKVILVRPGPGAVVRVVLVSRAVVGLWLHWLDGRSVPCLGEDNGCPYHAGAENWSLRWKGFAACARTRVAGPVNSLVEVTADAWANSPNLQRLSDAGKCRGIEIELARGNLGPRSRVKVAILGECRPVPWVAELPVDPGVKLMLEVLFPAAHKPKSLMRGVENEAVNLEQRQFLPDGSAGDEEQAN